MPVISCRSGTALLIYFKVSFRTVCLISTLHGAALPKGGKAPLPGKLVFFSPALDALCFIPPDTGEGNCAPKGSRMAGTTAVLAPACSCCGSGSSVLGMLRSGAGTREVPGLQRTVVTACV